MPVPEPRTCERTDRASGLFRNHLPIFPDINRCAVHPRDLPGRFCRTPERPPHDSGEFLRRFSCRAFLHSDRSSSRGDVPKFSYTAHASASRR